jgi:hypothetical protein
MRPKSFSVKQRRPANARAAPRNDICSYEYASNLARPEFVNGCTLSPCPLYPLERKLQHMQAEVPPSELRAVPTSRPQVRCLSLSNDDGPFPFLKPPGINYPMISGTSYPIDITGVQCEVLNLAAGRGLL